MHHYPHHVGEFAAVTRYMSRVERDIFRDMRDMYMFNERPLDGTDFNLLARRLGCVTPEELAALQFVLSEQFVQDDDGQWHNAWCDAKLQEFQGRDAAQQGSPKSAEAERKARSRARRAAIFSELAAVGVVPPATTKVTALHAMCRQYGIDVQAVYVAVNEGCDKSRTSHGQVTDKSRVNQKQNQNQIKETSSPKGGGDADVLSDPELVPSSEPQWAEIFGCEFSVEVSGYSQHDRKKFWPLAKGWVTAGVTVGQMRAAVQRARAEATEGIAYLPAYVDRVLASMSAPQESRAEAAARARMQEAAPLAAARQPGPVVPSPQAAPALDGYAFFAAQSKTFPALEVHDAVS